MHKKLIRRAATKYRTWMIKKSQQFLTESEITIMQHVRHAVQKSEEMEAWAVRFFQGSISRLQVNPWEPNVNYMGIISPDVYKSIATDMIPDLGEDIISSTKNVMKNITKINTVNLVTPLSPKETINEIEIVNKEWKHVKFKHNRLSVLIKNVSLSDEQETVDLGDFWICLNLIDPLDGPNIKSVHKIKSQSGGYHPHVRDNRLCTGHGEILIIEALCQGRLEDYFRIVEAILRTYNSDSPYDSLNEWYDPEHEDQFMCETCGEWRDNGGSCYCESCGETYCESCSADMGCCKECSEWRCSECSTYCYGCDEIVCKRGEINLDCSNSCNACKQDFCLSCIETCMICEYRYCSHCLKSCTHCGDKVCEDCITVCDNCENNYCTNCADTDCNECNENICKECNETCDGCGIMMCLSCKDEHKCLLKTISN